MASSGPTSDPYAGFRFRVNYDGAVANVTEVSGIKSKTDFQKIRQGGNNLHDEVMIQPHSYPEMLTLKRVFFPDKTQYFSWIQKVHSPPYTRKDVTLELLTQDDKVVGTYQFFRCIPAEFDGPGLSAKGGEVSVESVKIRYDYFTYTPGS
jgi:phage tail-like protein